MSIDTMTCIHHPIRTIVDGGCVYCWKERAEKAEAACAQKDEALKTAVVFNPGGKNWFCYRCGTLVPNHSPNCQIGDALSSSCGHGYLPPDKARVLVEALREILLLTEAWNLLSFQTIAKKVAGIAKQALDKVKEEQ